MQICRKKGLRWRSRVPARHVTFQLCQVLSQAAFAQSSPSTRCSALCTLPRPAWDVSLLNLSPLHFKPINAEISPADSQARGQRLEMSPETKYLCNSLHGEQPSRTFRDSVTFSTWVTYSPPPPQNLSAQRLRSFTFNIVTLRGSI